MDLTDYETQCYYLKSAVYNGEIEVIREFEEEFGRSYLESWIDRHELLSLAVRQNHTEVLKLLLGYECEERELYSVPDFLLNIAVANGNEDIAKLLIDSQTNVDYEGRNDCTHLHAAAENGNLRIANYLLQNDASIYFTCSTATYFYRKGYVPLHIASEKGNVDMVSLLLKNGSVPLVNVKTDSGLTSLHIAVQKRHHETVSVLLEYGAYVNSTNFYNETPLHLAVKSQCDFSKHESANSNNKPYSDLLVNGGVQNINELKKQEYIADLLINYGCNVNAKDINGKSPIYYAIESENFNNIELLLANQANVKDSFEPFHLAVTKRYKIAVQLLLTHNADVHLTDTDGRTALHLIASDFVAPFCVPCTRNRNESNPADSHENEEIAKLLLIHGVVDAKDYHGMTALHSAVDRGFFRIVKLLLQNDDNLNSKSHCDSTTKADVHARNFAGLAPLDSAIKNGNEQITELLLQHKADVYKGYTNEGTALHTAVSSAKFKILKLILKMKPEMNVNLKDADGKTPFYLAVAYENVSIINFLKHFCNANVNSKSNDGTTPLHVAACGKNVELVKTLLKCNADVNITNEGKTPLDLALLNVTATDIIYRYDNLVAHEKIANILTKHIFKMKASNFYVSQGNFESIYNHGKAKQWGEECENEIKNMVAKKSVFDIFTKNVHYLAMRTMSIENTTQCLKLNQPVFRAEFPVYSSMLESQLSDAIERKELFEKSDVIFYNFLPVALHDCVSKISGYLSNDNLKDLIYACESK